MRLTKKSWNSGNQLPSHERPALLNAPAAVACGAPGWAPWQVCGPLPSPPSTRPGPVWIVASNSVSVAPSTRSETVVVACADGG
jgi:hypothetical protein